MDREGIGTEDGTIEFETLVRLEKSEREETEETEGIPESPEPAMVVNANSAAVSEEEETEESREAEAPIADKSPTNGAIGNCWCGKGYIDTGGAGCIGGRGTELKGGYDG